MLTYQHPAIKNAIAYGNQLAEDDNYFDSFDQIFKTQFNCTISWSIQEYRYQRCFKFNTPTEQTAFILRFS